MKKQPTFTLPVNFFDDDRMIPVSALYGPVGEIVAIRILSMIYSNGYYLDWTELNRCRLLRAIPSLTPERLDEIVECLVTSGLFDADLFTREGILTSADIQTEYLRSHRRRIKPDTPLPYFLIPIPEKKIKDGEPKDGEPKAGELPAHQPETPEILEIPENIETPESLETLEILETLENVENIENPKPLILPPKTAKALKLKRLLRRRRKRKHKRR